MNPSCPEIARCLASPSWSTWDGIRYRAEKEKDKKKTRQQQQAVAWAMLSATKIQRDQGRCYRGSDWLNRLGVCDLEEETTPRSVMGAKTADRKLRDRNENEGVDVNVKSAVTESRCESEMEGCE